MLGNIRGLGNKVCKRKILSVFENSLNVKVFMQMRMLIKNLNDKLFWLLHIRSLSLYSIKFGVKINL